MLAHAAALRTPVLPGPAVNGTARPSIDRARRSNKVSDFREGGECDEVLYCKSEAVWCLNAQQNTSSSQDDFQYANPLWLTSQIR